MKAAFIISWLLSSALMMGLGYLWHGVVLNDLVRSGLSDMQYLSFSAIAYSFIGLVLMGVLAFIADHRKLPIRAMLIGAFIGVLFMTATIVLGMSVSPVQNTTYLLVDYTWQAIEQGLGGGFAGLMYDVLTFKRRLKSAHS